MLLGFMDLSFIGSENFTLILAAGSTFTARSAGLVPITVGAIPSGTAQAVPAKAIIPTTRAARVAINIHLAFTTFSFLSLGRWRRHCCYYSASVVSGGTQVLGKSLAPSPAFRTSLLRCVVGALFCSFFTGR